VTNFPPTSLWCCRRLLLFILEERRRPLGHAIFLGHVGDEPLLCWNCWSEKKMVIRPLILCFMLSSSSLDCFCVHPVCR
jgi:hypothetical protein